MKTFYLFINVIYLTIFLQSIKPKKNDFQRSLNNNKNTSFNNKFQLKIQLEKETLSALKAGNLAKIKLLLKNKENPFIEKKKQQILFEKACQVENIEIATHIVKEYPMRIDQYQTTLLKELCMEGKEKAIRFLMERVVKYKDPTKLIKKMITQGNLAMSFLLLPFHKNLKKNAPKLFFTSCIYNQISLVAFFIQSEKIKINVNLQDSKGNTGFIYACKEGHLNLIQILINEFKANIFLRNKKKRNGYMIAAMMGHVHILEYLDHIKEYKISCNDQDYLDRNASLLAVQNGRLNALKYLYENKKDPLTATDVYKNNHLMIASLNDHFYITKYLVDRNMQIFHHDNNGKHIMQLVLEKKNPNTKIIAYLIQHKNIEEIYKRPLYPLLLNKSSRHNLIIGYICKAHSILLLRRSSQKYIFKLIYEKISQFLDNIFYLEDNIWILKRFKRKNASYNRVPDSFPAKLFALGCVTNTLESAKWAWSLRILKKCKIELKILQKVVHYNAINTLKWLESLNNKEYDKYMNHMLFEAFHCGNTFMMHYLSSKGAFLIINNLISTAEEFQKLTGRSYHNQVLHQDKIYQKMTLACQKGDLDFIKWAIEYKYLVIEDALKKYSKKEKKLEKIAKKKRAQFMYFLCEAAKYNQINVVKFLTKKWKININNPDIEGNSLLGIACRYSRLSIVKFLLSFSPDLSYVDQAGNNVFMLACLNKNNAQHLKYLKKKFPFSLSVKNKQKRTPFLLACWRGSLAMIKFLFRPGDLKSQDKLRNTGLLLAAISGHQEKIEWLLEKGSDLFHKNRLGQKALDLAKQSNNQLLAIWLQKKESEKKQYFE